MHAIARCIVADSIDGYMAVRFEHCDGNGETWSRSPSKTLLKVAIDARQICVLHDVGPGELPGDMALVDTELSVEIPGFLSRVTSYRGSAMAKQIEGDRLVRRA